MKVKYAVGFDAGNASMRAAGRTVWNANDHKAATDAFMKVQDKEIVTRAKRKA